MPHSTDNSEDGHPEFDEAAYEEGYNAPDFGDRPDLDDVDEAPEQFTAEEHALAAQIKAHWARMKTDASYAQGVREAQRDAASYEHEQAWLYGQHFQL